MNYDCPTNTRPVPIFNTSNFPKKDPKPNLVLQTQNHK